MRGAPALGALLALACLGAAPQRPGAEGGTGSPRDGGAASPPVVLVGHEVTPDGAAPGSEVRERIVLHAVGGVRLSVEDVPGAPDGDVERLGAWEVTRAPLATGGVEWRFERPTTAWTTGAHATPEVRVGRAGGTGPLAPLRLAGVTFQTSSPLPGDQRRLSPAGAEGPLPPRRSWPALWALLPLALATGSGVAWRRRTHRRTPVPVPAGPEPGKAAPGLQELLADPPAGAGELAAFVAHALRLHPVLRKAGVRPAHTTEEVLARCGGLDGLEDLLRLADGWTYGGEAPDPQVVETVILRIVEQVEHA